MTGPGPRWIGCRIKGSPILTTRAQSHTCKGQRKEIHPLLLEIFKSTAPLGAIDVYIGLLCTQNFGFIVVVFLSPENMIITLITSSSPEACLGGQVLLICLVNKANLSGECLRIKFIWTSFSASLPPALLLLKAEEEGCRIDCTLLNRT